MNTQTISKNTAAWRFKAWVSFLLAFGMTIGGIICLPAPSAWAQAFILMGLLFTVNSSFSLAKTIRDDHEADKLINRVTEAKTAKILREYED
ncbi:MAG: YiaA/YiaB family inner membrane protein [Flammeovirgaceae bacterium]